MQGKVLWPLEPSTEAKHRLYKRYLDAWWPIMLQQPWVKCVTYVDAFAGPGEYTGGEEGSPVFALDRLLNHHAVNRMSLSRERVRLVFIEEDQRRYEHLLALLTERFGPLEKLPVSVKVKHGRAEEDTLPLLDRLDAWGHPILAVFDSWGNVGVPWDQIQTIAANRSSEVIVTFGSNWFSRRQTEEPAKLDDVFGGAEHWSACATTSSPADRWRVWMETYNSALLRAGFEFALGFQVVPKTGQPLDLLFGTGHTSGVEAFKDAMWNVDTSDGMRFSDPRTTLAKQDAMRAMQPTLFDDLDAPDPELLGFIVDRLASGSSTVQEMRDYLLRETARWLPKHARGAAAYLVKEGRVSRHPEAGQLKRDVVLRLRG